MTDKTNMKKTGKKGRLITCPYCNMKFRIYSRKRTPLQKLRERNRARMRRANKKLAKALTKAMLGQDFN